MKLRTLAASLALALPLLASCRSDDSLDPPDLSNNDGLLRRYVAVGNSITAGFQSAGINDSTQERSYAKVFAGQGRAPFFAPLLNKPGCPPPFTVNVTQTRVGGGTPTTCALRTTSRLPYVSNVAVPGATSFSPIDNLTPGANSNALTTFILGGKNQVAAMQAAQPTFVSVWIGNNDILGALTTLPPGNPGDVTKVVPVAAFQANYGKLLDSVAATGARAALFTVADVTVIPYGTAGSVYWCLKTGLCPGVPAGGFPPTFTVANSCAPGAAIPGSKGDSVLVPWTIGITKLSAAATPPFPPQTVDCAVDAEVVTPAEFKAMRDAVDGYNAFITAQAAEREWALVDINLALLAFKNEATPPGQLPKITTFPVLPSGPAQPNVLFGTLFSLDGVHPSSAAHRIIADSLISAVNRTYGTSIPFAGP